MRHVFGFPSFGTVMLCSLQLGAKLKTVVGEGTGWAPLQGGTAVEQSI